MKSNFLVGVVIVTWNNERDIRECLKSLLAQSQSVEIVVVDNDSKDKTKEIIKKEFPIVKLIEQPKNYLLCKSNNDGIKYLWANSTIEYVMVLNPDTKLEKNTVEVLLRGLQKDEQVAAIGPKILFWKNKNEGKINSAGLIFDGFMQCYDRGFLEKDNGQHNKAENVTALSGACILYRLSALKKSGLYLESLKMYMDDLEMCIRLNKNGYKIMYEPKAILHHAYMASTSQNKEFSISKQKMLAWLLIALKHYPIKSKLAMLKKYIGYKATGKVSL